MTIETRVQESWKSKSNLDWELCCTINSENPLITWEEYYEMNKLHIEFEEGCEKLGFKLPYN